MCNGLGLAPTHSHEPITQTGDQPATFTISGTSNRLSSISGALARSYAYNASGSLWIDSWHSQERSKRSKRHIGLPGG